MSQHLGPLAAILPASQQSSIQDILDADSTLSVADVVRPAVEMYLRLMKQHGKRYATTDPPARPGRLCKLPGVTIVRR